MSCRLLSSDSPNLCAKVHCAFGNLSRRAVSPFLSGLVILSIVAGCAGRQSGGGNADGDRSWRVWVGERPLLEISDRPGPIRDTSAPPPPPGSTVAIHPFLSAACGGDPMLCSRAGEILRASDSLDAFLEALDDEGWRVEELD